MEENEIEVVQREDLKIKLAKLVISAAVTYFVGAFVNDAVDRVVADHQARQNDN